MNYWEVIVRPVLAFFKSKPGAFVILLITFASASLWAQHPAFSLFAIGLIAYQFFCVLLGISLSRFVSRTVKSILFAIFGIFDFNVKAPDLLPSKLIWFMTFAPIVFVFSMMITGNFIRFLLITTKLPYVGWLFSYLLSLEPVQHIITGFAVLFSLWIVVLYSEYMSR
ncbi:MAG: hypothetical protein SNJ60_04290 [Pseudanabaenaceae cyanobacterium]